jgi:hypothetical protein
MSRKQDDDVLDALELMGGYATFPQLNRAIDFSLWKTKTPEASVRRIVQKNPEFFKIQPGLWGLTSAKREILRRLGATETDIHGQQNSQYTHYYFQGLVSQIGIMKRFTTFIPPQDKNKPFLEKSLADVATTTVIPKFTFESIVQRAKTIDTIWFNERMLPDSFFEVEHSTDIKNSLLKYYELQDFAAGMIIVADSSRRNLFTSIISQSIFKPIQARVKFYSYDNVVRWYENLAELHSAEKDIGPRR